MFELNSLTKPAIYIRFSMLDEAGHDLDLSDSRFNSSLKKVALALQINNGKSN